MTDWLLFGKFSLFTGKNSNVKVFFSKKFDLTRYVAN